MSFASYSFDGTVQAIPLEETNHQRAPRPVFIKRRKVGGKRGKTLRAFSKFVLVPVVGIALILDDSDDDDDYSDDDDDDYSDDNDDDSDVSTVIEIGLAHWGVQVGDYLWELHTDRKHAKTLSMQRLTRSQIWRADVGEEEVGNTNMTDVEIDSAANAALEKMKTQCGGKYHEVDNNCHDFVRYILKELNIFYAF